MSTPPSAGPAEGIRDLRLVLGLGVVCALHIGKLPAAIPVIQKDLGISLVDAGLLLSLIQLAGMLLGLLVGGLADRWGSARVMGFGLVLLCLGGLLAVTAEGLTGFMLSRAVEGVGFLWAVLPAPALLRQRITQADVLARALGWWGAYMPTGMALALAVGVPVMHAWGWRAVWWFLVGLTAVVAVLFVRRFCVSAPGRSKPVGEANPSSENAVMRTLRSGGPWLLAGAFFLYSSQWIAVVGFLPTIYMAAGLSSGVVGLLSASAAAVNVLGNVAAGRCLGSGTAPERLLVTGYALMALGAAGAFWPGWGAWAQYLSVLLFSAAGGLVPGTLFGLAVRLAPARDSTSSTVGWMQQGSSAGQFLGPLAVAWVAADQGGWAQTPWITGAASLMGVAMAVLLGRRLKIT